MNIQIFDWKSGSVLNAAIIVGMVAIFLSIAVPLIHGAVIRQHAAECARKMIQAADAFDFYAASCGHYPESQQILQEMERVMKDSFAVYGINWWESATDLGGQWSWYSNGHTSSVVIVGAETEPQMVLLDQLIDDGNLDTGAFQRRCSRYHYIIKDSVL